MKTIRIPLELAEEVLADMMREAGIMKMEFGYPSEPIEEFLPESYCKLKKLVDKQKESIIKIRCKDLASLNKETESIKVIAEFVCIEDIKAFVESTGETYWFNDGEWVRDPFLS